MNAALRMMIISGEFKTVFNLKTLTCGNEWQCGELAGIAVGSAVALNGLMAGWVCYSSLSCIIYNFCIVAVRNDNHPSPMRMWASLLHLRTSHDSCFLLSRTRNDQSIDIWALLKPYYASLKFEETLNQRFEWNLFFFFVAGQSLVLQWIQQGP